MRRGRPRIPASPRAAFLLLLASFALVTGPLWHGLAHSHQGFETHSETLAATPGHAECDGWQVESEAGASHDRHSDLQFETARRDHHRHHALCQGHASLTGDTLDAAGVLAPLPVLELPGRAPSLPASSRVASPPSRGPPSLV